MKLCFLRLLLPLPSVLSLTPLRPPSAIGNTNMRFFPTQSYFCRQRNGQKNNWCGGNLLHYNIKSIATEHDKFLLQEGVHPLESRNIY